MLTSILGDIIIMPSKLVIIKNLAKEVIPWIRKKSWKKAETKMVMRL